MLHERRVQRQGAGVDRLRGGFFVSSSPDGSGTSVGATLYLHAQRTQERSLHVPDQLLGAGLQRRRVLALARRYRTPNVEVVKDPSSAAADDLVAGRIVGWFQGRMEFGQRALGNRSILLDPRRPDGKDIVNSAMSSARGSVPSLPPSSLTESPTTSPAMPRRGCRSWRRSCRSGKTSGARFLRWCMSTAPAAPIAPDGHP